MTIGHLLLAAGMSVYMLIAIRYEEHDLVSRFGRDYELDRERAGMLMPRFRRQARRLTSYAASTERGYGAVRSWTPASPTSATGSSTSTIASIRREAGCSS